MNRVQELEKKIHEIHMEIDSIQEACQHTLEPTMFDGEKLGHKPCKKCNKLDRGWWCPNNPTTYCNYEQEDGTVNEDSCRYCGAPLERK